MSNTPLFSVLMANYNNGKYILEAIESVKQQTYSNWEIIIVDDGSTDNSQELYHELEKDNRIHIYHNETNKGCGFTKRRCVELASGEICGFLDPDDKLTSGALKLMIELHAEKKECSIVYSTHFIWNDIDDKVTIADYIGEIDKNKDYLICKNKNISAFATFKRNLYLQTIGINKYLKSAVDHDLYYLLEEVGSLYYHNENLYYYRVTNLNSISTGSDKKVKEAYFSDIMASINACERRIINKSELYLRNKEKYLQILRIWINYYSDNKKKSKIRFTTKFYFNYLRCHNFSTNSFLHLLKLNPYIYSLIKSINNII